MEEASKQGVPQVVTTLPLARIGEQFSNLRIINPEADQAVQRSLEKYGQLTPVVVSEVATDHYELLDGFKRLRAARKLSLERLIVRKLRLTSRAGKAAIVQLNWVGQSINSMEEALVIHSLFQEDSLTQVEIATLLSRHKSWVCRRIAMIERLCDEGREHIKLGLLPISMSRELIKLPRGNQPDLLTAIGKHHLGCRETKALVETLLSRPEREHSSILRAPGRHLQPDEPLEASLPSFLSPLAREIYRKLLHLERCCLNVSHAVGSTELNQFETKATELLLAGCAQAVKALARTGETLRQVTSGAEEVSP